MQVPVKMRDMTHSHGRHDSLKSATGLSDGADRSESWDGECASGARQDLCYVCDKDHHGSFACATRLMSCFAPSSSRDVTRDTCATWIIMDHSHVRHDSCHVFAPSRSRDVTHVTCATRIVLNYSHV